MMPARKPLRREPYIYSGSSALTANSTGQLIFQISSGFDFLMTRFSYRASVTQGNIIPAFDIQILKDTYQVMNDYVPNELFTGVMREQSTAPYTRYVMGIAANWFKFDVPQMFEAKSNLIINLRNQIGYTNTVQIAIAGYKNVYIP